MAYLAAEILDGEVTHRDHALLVSEGRVEALLPRSDMPDEVSVRDLGAGLLAPGFVDLQVNGGGGVLFNDAPGVETIHTICQAHLKFGTTALLVTLVTADRATTAAAIEAAQAAAAAQVPGFAGLHLEGPHLSVAKKGAHAARFIRPMTADDRDQLTAAAANLPSLMVTLAPENASLEDIAALRQAGVTVSLGHTTADLATAMDAARAGASCVTHLFNAMNGLHHREPGLIGAAIDHGGLSAGLIADGIHVDPAVIRMALRAKTGPGRIFLVTDAMSTIGTDLSGFELDGRTVRRREGALRLADGTLAGADLDMISALRFLITEIGAERDEALRMASAYPAGVVGRESELGRLVAGSRADFIHLNDDMSIASVWIAGRQAA